jgi:hypothetical protein
MFKKFATLLVIILAVGSVFAIGAKVAELPWSIFDVIDI